jgi:hypothetical protein
VRTPDPNERLGNPPPVIRQGPWVREAESRENDHCDASTVDRMVYQIQGHRTRRNDHKRRHVHSCSARHGRAGGAHTVSLSLKAHAAEWRHLTNYGSWTGNDPIKICTTASSLQRRHLTRCIGHSLTPAMRPLPDAFTKFSP